MKDSRELILALFKIGAIKFGEFKLKSGLISPYYLDLRFLASYPEILKGVAGLFGKKLKKLDFDLVAGVPYAAIPIATAIALQFNWPMIYTRKEKKEHGTGKLIEGIFKPGQKVLVIDDVISDGASKLEVITPLTEAGLIVHDIAVLLDRGQGGPQVVKSQGYNCICLTSIDEVLEILKSENLITEKQVKKAEEFRQSLKR